MKRSDLYKTIQLIILVLLTAACLALIFLKPGVFHQVASDSAMRILCILLWVVLGVSFVFLYIDFSYSLSIKKEYKEMDHDVHFDPVAGIANRFSCDVLIEKYLDKPLPEDLGCIMFDLTNIREINREFGHVQGNVLIREFSDILRLASSGRCFVGRNGGNKFLAIFEKGSESSMEQFLTIVSDEVAAHNLKSDVHPIKYCSGSAFHEKPSEGILTITELIALSNRRLLEKEMQ